MHVWRPDGFLWPSGRTGGRLAAVRHSEETRPCRNDGCSSWLCRVSRVRTCAQEGEASLGTLRAGPAVTSPAHGPRRDGEARDVGLLSACRRRPGMAVRAERPHLKPGRAKEREHRLGSKSDRRDQQVGRVHGRIQRTAARKKLNLLAKPVGGAPDKQSVTPPVLLLV